MSTVSDLALRASNWRYDDLATFCEKVATNISCNTKEIPVENGIRHKIYDLCTKFREAGKLAEMLWYHDRDTELDQLAFNFQAGDSIMDLLKKAIEVDRKYR